MAGGKYFNKEKKCIKFNSLLMMSFKIYFKCQKFVPSLMTGVDFWCCRQNTTQGQR